MARPKVMVPLTCAWCGQGFQRRRCDHDKSVKLGSTQFYCSKACSQAHHAVKNAKPCQTCGKPVNLTRKSRNAAYCSEACRPTPVKPAQRTCPECSEAFQPRYSRQVYCGATCASTAHAKRMRGATNSNYRTGSDSAYLYDRMRPLILERDKTCAVCSAPGPSLHCHHINEDRNDNAPENLVMLCAAHHMEHHKSAQTPFSWLSGMAEARTSCMTSKWKTQVASLQKTFL